MNGSWGFRATTDLTSLGFTLGPCVSDDRACLGCTLDPCVSDGLRKGDSIQSSSSNDGLSTLVSSEVGPAYDELLSSLPKRAATVAMFPRPASPDVRRAVPMSVVSATALPRATLSDPICCEPSMNGSQSRGKVVRAGRTSAGGPIPHGHQKHKALKMLNERKRQERFRRLFSCLKDVLCEREHPHNSTPAKREWQARTHVDRNYSSVPSPSS